MNSQPFVLQYFGLSRVYSSWVLEMAVFLFKSVHQPKYLTMEFKVEQEEGMETNFALKQAFK